MLVQAFQNTSVKRSVSTVSSGFLSLLGGVSTKNGVSVTGSSALTLPAFYNAVNIIANDVAKLPKSVYQKIDKNAQKVSNHPLQKLIAKEPNAYMTAFMHHFVLAIDAILKGNGFAEIIKDEYSGQIKSLLHIDQAKYPVTIKKYDGKLWYSFNGRVLPADDVFHIPGFSFNGLSGIGVVELAARSLGVALSSQEFAEEYYASKGIGTGVVTSTKQMDNDAKKRYSDALSKTLSNSNPFKVAVVDEAGSFQHIKLTPQESLFLETNKQAVEEVARWLNIPLYKLKYTENQNNSNMEHQSMSHVVDSILPWQLKFEQEYNRKCFTASEKDSNHYVKFNTNVLLLADKKTQAEFYSTMFNIMAMTPADIREKEELNHIDGLDQPFLPVNIQSLEQLKLNVEAKKKELNSTGNE